MVKINILTLLLILFTATSCSKKVTVKIVNKPFYKDFEKSVKISYKDYGNSISYSDYYNDGKFEIDKSINFRNRILDSLNLIKRSKWLLIKLNSTNYSGTYEKTFIIFDNKCVYYYLDALSITENIDVNECPIENLNIHTTKDVYDLYNFFENEKITKMLDNKPSTNPLLVYNIINVNNKKLSLYKLSSKDYKIESWN